MKNKTFYCFIGTAKTEILNKNGDKIPVVNTRGDKIGEGTLVDKEAGKISLSFLYPTDINALSEAKPLFENGTLSFSYERVTAYEIALELECNKDWFNEYQRIEDEVIDLLEVTHLDDGTQNIIDVIRKLKAKAS
jgi:hypothetical protein